MLLTYISGGYNSESGVGFGSVMEVSGARFACGESLTVWGQLPCAIPWSSEVVGKLIRES